MPRSLQLYISQVSVSTRVGSVWTWLCVCRVFVGRATHLLTRVRLAPSLKPIQRSTRRGSAGLSRHRLGSASGERRAGKVDCGIEIVGRRGGRRAEGQQSVSDRWRLDSSCFVSFESVNGARGRFGFGPVAAADVCRAPDARPASEGRYMRPLHAQATTTKTGANSPRSAPDELAQAPCQIEELLCLPCACLVA